VATTTIDASRLEAFMGHAVVDLAAAFSAPLVRLGARLGLYRALVDSGPATPAELAERTGTDPRMVREWLGNQAAGGYVTYDAASGRYALPPEQAIALADAESPVYLLGAYDILASFFADEDRLVEAFHSGTGLHWNEHDHRLFSGTEVFFRAGYRQHLVQDWLPSLDGVVEKLEAGARVADVGCGHGASTIIMAEAFPASSFAGFDSHPGGIERAREAAEEAGVGERVRFEVAAADAFPRAGYDLVCLFDAFHDLGDPAAAARHIREALAPDGTLMLVEPQAGDRTEDNLNPVGRLFYAGSTLICVPHAIADSGGRACALGNQAGEAALRAVLEQGGLRSVRRAAETPFNIILEARP
jgi:SAM-dependent methyltransferase